MVAFGLGALLAVSELAYTLLKWCGAGYLCWLGIQLPCAHASNLTPIGRIHSTSNWFLRGMLGNVLNPKMGVILRFVFTSVYPRRTFTRQLDLSAGHYPCINWYAVVGNLITATAMPPAPE
jgi:threonine/homoserine/homoserine lactone efflux protein